MSTRKRINWIATAVVSVGICQISWGSTYVVGAPNTPCPGANFSTIGAALNVVVDGDTIEVCPAAYPEQVVITKPVTLVGIAWNGVGRAVIQPTTLTANSLGFIAVVTVANTPGVTISNLAIDASNNAATGCAVSLSGIHFYNSSGSVLNSSISGTQLPNPTSCTTLFPGNGSGVQADQSGTAGSYTITVQGNSIHDFGRNGVLVNGAGQNATVSGNSITGIGPSTGVNQFGVFLANGAVGQVTGNSITQGNCGTVSIANCRPIRSEGVVLRSVGSGVVIANNIISNVQAGIFVNGATGPQVTGNIVSSVDAYDGIHIQGSVGGLYSRNMVFHVGPLTTDSSSAGEGCGIQDITGSGSSANTIQLNWVNDAYCGVAYVTSDILGPNYLNNTLYYTINGDTYPGGINFPAPVEPGGQM
jgi:parallel beta-helix repeat protein